MKYFILFCLMLPIAVAQKIIINPDHSEFLFEISYLKLSKVSGRFTRFSGGLNLESDKISELSFQLESDSIDTGNGPRDTHLKNKDFLEAKKYPIISFQSDSVKKNGKDYLVQGRLNFKGKFYSEQVQVKLKGPILDTWKKKSWFLEFKHELSRKRLGLDWNKTLSGDEFILGDEITVMGRMQLQLPHAQTPGSKHKTSDNSDLRLREKFFRGEVKEIPKTKESFVIDSPQGKIEVPIMQPIVLSKPDELKEEKILWPAYMFLAFFGFIGVMATAFLLKSNNKFYLWSEEKLWKNFIFDFLMIVIVYVYGWAAFELMPR